MLLPALVLDTGLRAGLGRGLADHPSLRAEVVGEAKKRLLVREYRATLDPADVVPIDTEPLG